MKNLKAVIIALILSASFFTCSPMPFSRSGNLSATLSFSLPENQNIVSRAMGKGVSDNLEATHIGVISLGGNNGWQWHAHVEYIELAGSLDVEITLPKDKIYAVSVYGPNEDGQLVSIAPVKPGAFDLDTFPLAGAGADIIDLGEVFASPEGYISGLGELTTSTVLGYAAETLREFGAYDSQVIRLQNPDANIDGLIDYEQGIFWELWLSNNYELKQEASTLEPDLNLPVDSFLTDPYVSVGFWTIEPFEQTNFTSYDLRLEIPFTVHDDSNNEVDFLLSQFFGPSENGVDGHETTHLSWMVDTFGAEPGQGAFSHYTVSSYSPRGPWPGNYIMHIGEKKYLINDVNFFSPADKKTDIPFPVYEFEYNSDNKPTVLSWRWYRVEDNLIVPAGAEFVKMMIAAFIPQLGPYITPGPMGVDVENVGDWWNGGRIENDSSFEDVDLTVSFLSFFIRDLRGNTFHFSCPDTYLGDRE